MREAFIKFRKRYVQQLVKVCFKDRKKNGKLLNGVQLFKKKILAEDWMFFLLWLNFFVGVCGGGGFFFFIKDKWINLVCNSAFPGWWICMVDVSGFFLLAPADQVPSMHSGRWMDAHWAEGCSVVAALVLGKRFCWGTAALSWSSWG